MRYYYVTVGICLVFSYNLVSYYMYCLCFACLSIVWLLYTVLSLIIIFKLSFCWNEIKIISNNFKNYIYEINFYLFSGPHSNKGHLPEPYRATDSIPTQHLEIEMSRSESSGTSGKPLYVTGQGIVNTDVDPSSSQILLCSRCTVCAIYRITFKNYQCLDQTEGKCKYF